jgi:hypothetical protein
MLRKFFATALAAFVTATVPVVTVQASDCGAPSCYQPCQDTCCYPKVRYKTCYQNVIEEQTRTCYQTVQKTVMKECREVVCKPVWEEKIVECRKIVCKPVWEEKQIKVCCGEWREEKHYCEGPCVTRKCRLPDTCCVDPCTGCSHRVKGQTVCYQEQLPGRWVCKKVWVPREEIRTVKVCKNVQETVVEKVPVKTCRMVQETVVKQVPVTICEKVPVCTKVQVCKRVKVCVPVCECECKKPSCFSGLFHRKSCCEAQPCCDGGYAAPAAPAGAAPSRSEKMPPPTEKK